MLLLLAILGSLAALLGQTTAAPPKATLRLVDDSAPAALRGLGFRPREHVRLTVVSGTERSVRKVVATRLGRFVVRLQADVNACTGFSASAVGNMGTRATLKRAPGQCPDLGPPP